MNLIDVSNKLKTEDQCLDFIEKVRWPDGEIRCVRCGNDRVSRITRTVDQSKTRKEKKQNKRTRLYACLEPTCKHRFTPTAGTLFHDSHLPLSKWFAAVALIVHAKKGMSAKQVQRHLGVNYRTAWYMGHRIRKAMASGEGIIGGGPSGGGSAPKLTGTVEVDETFIGARRKMERKMQNKNIVMGLRQRGGDLRLVHIPDVTAKSLGKQISEHVDKKVERIITDELAAYPVAVQDVGLRPWQHETIRHTAKVYVDGDVHTNTIESAFSLFKRGLIGSFHSVSGKHLQRYLSEFQFRFNRREMPDLFGATVAQMVRTSQMEYKNLVA
jgi:transposase-like protein